MHYGHRPQRKCVLLLFSSEYVKSANRVYRAENYCLIWKKGQRLGIKKYINNEFLLPQLYTKLVMLSIRTCVDFRSSANDHRVEGLPLGWLYTHESSHLL